MNELNNKSEHRLLDGEKELPNSFNLETNFGFLAGESRIGGRAENQDSFGYFQKEGTLLVVVCDGMGGANGGKLASSIATQVIINEFSKSSFLNDKAKFLSDAIKKANEVVFSYAFQHEGFKGMGTTVVAMIIDDESATVAHVGDSRVYQIRRKRKIFRTFDHSMVFELVIRKVITEEQARLSAESNIILKALGTNADIEVEVKPNLPYLRGDRFLLCSDGICGAVPEKKLIELLSNSDVIDKVNLRLTEHIDAVGKEEGGKHDNLTSALIQLSKNSKLKTKMEKRSKLIIGILSFLLLVSLAFIYYTQFFAVDKNKKTESNGKSQSSSLCDIVAEKKNDSTIYLNKEREGLKIEIDSLKKSGAISKN